VGAICPNDSSQAASLWVGQFFGVHHAVKLRKMLRPDIARRNH